MEDMSIVKEYGIPDGKIIGSFGLDRLDDVINEIYEHKDDVLRVAETGEVLTFEEFTPYHVTGTVTLCENGLVIKLEEHNDQNAKHEDAGKSELYIMDNEIVYIVTEVDPRINNEYKINQSKSKRYEGRIGNAIEIPKELKSASNLFEKIKHLLNSGKRKKLSALRQSCLFRIEEYVNKLILTEIEIGE